MYYFLPVKIHTYMSANLTRPSPHSSYKMFAYVLGSSPAPRLGTASFKIRSLSLAIRGRPSLPSSLFPSSHTHTPSSIPFFSLSHLGDNYNGGDSSRRGGNQSSVPWLSHDNASTTYSTTSTGLCRIELESSRELREKEYNSHQH